jgi:hypothetical protein
VRGIQSNHDVARALVLGICGLLIAGSILFRHGLTLAMGSSMTYLSGKALLLGTIILLSLVLGLSVAGGIWRR